MARANILVDSGYWIALYTPEDPQLHKRAVRLVHDLENNTTLIPWPTLYEFVNTRLARRRENLFAFEQWLLKPNVERLSDEIYKAVAINNVFELNKTRTASISLVDEVIRQILIDRKLKIDFLVTFNRADFEYPCQIADVGILE